MRILFFVAGQDGVGYYRMLLPSKMIQKLGLAYTFMNPFDPTGKPWKDKKLQKERDSWYNFEQDKNGDPVATNVFAKVLGDPKKPNFDAVIFQRADVATMFSMAMCIRDIYKIPVIQETDDYVFAIPGTNPAIQSYKDKPTEHRANGEDPLTIARMSLGNYDGYIVSTPFLKQFYDNYAPTYLCPNSIDLSKRKQTPKKKHKDFRIMFSSSATHWDNLKFLMPVIEKFLKKYPDATFYQYDAFPNFLKSKQVKLMKWVHPDNYWKYIHSLSPDVCLAPLSDVLFNRAKSNLRLLEYWTGGKNAVIASPVEPYKNTIVDGKNGLLAKSHDEWFEKLEYLYNNPKVRERLGREGYATVRKDFNLEKNARKWTDAVKSIIDSYDPNSEPPKQYQPF